MSEQIIVDKYVARAKSFGLNVFFGHSDSYLKITVYWDNEQGDYTKFLKLAKDSGASIIVVDRFLFEDSNIDDEKFDEKYYEGKAIYEKVKGFNSRLEAFRQYVGKVGMVSLSWFSNGTEYKYVESVQWTDNYFALLDEIKDEFGE